MTQNLRSHVTMAVLLAVCSLALAGWLKPIDNLMLGWRFGNVDRPATGSVVYVDIDARSLKQIGVWPWPRSVHAQLIDALVASDASDIVFDVDFSAASSDAEDAELERALYDAGGFVLLASFVQALSDEDEPALNLPLSRFAENATLVSVNVPTDRDGLVRRYFMELNAGGYALHSIAAELSPVRGDIDDSILLNFGIDVSTVPRYPLSDVLNGAVGAAELSGRQVVIGASALELRDTFAVPRYGTLPGAMIHILAAENLKQDAYLREIPPAATVLVALLVAVLIALVLRSGTAVIAGAVGIAVLVGTEMLALGALKNFSASIDTFVVHASVLAFGVVSLGYELAGKASQLDMTAKAHARTRNVLDRVISNNFDGIVVVDMRGDVLMASRLAEDVLGQGTRDIVGWPMTDLLPETLSERMRRALDSADYAANSRLTEIALTDPSGNEMMIEYAITVSEPEGGAEPDGAAGRVACLTFRDVTDRKTSEERLRYLASHDPLTGALSRTRLVDIINVAMGDMSRREAGVTVFLLDLSRFKAVNDSLGHSYGDSVLQQVARRLKSSEVSAVARLGGDEFAMIRPGVYSSTAVEAFCTSILKRVSDVYLLGEHRAIVGAKIGVTNTSLSGYDPEMLLSHADMALSAAKSQPGNSFHVYTPDMERKLRETQDMEVALRSAIALNQLHLTYQPQVNLQDGQLIGVEALVRWTHPELGPVSPGKFIPVAEETGLIIELGRWIMETSCREVATWPGDIKLAVNVSPLQFEFGDVVADVLRVLAQSGLPAERLDIEITEGMLISNPKLITANLQTLRDIGVGVAIDDFGTGYSSLSYLGKLPVNKIKIDQSFVRGLPEDEESAAIVRAVMTLAESLGKTVVAEGIEREEQAFMLRVAGCHVGQGFYYGKSLRTSEMSARIARLAKEQSLAAG